MALGRPVNRLYNALVIILELAAKTWQKLTKLIWVFPSSPA
jgi:hypothetical protein